MKTDFSTRTLLPLATVLQNGTQQQILPVPVIGFLGVPFMSMPHPSQQQIPHTAAFGRPTASRRQQTRGGRLTQTGAGNRQFPASASFPRDQFAVQNRYRSQQQENRQRCGYPNANHQHQFNRTPNGARSPRILREIPMQQNGLSLFFEKNL